MSLCRLISDIGSNGHLSLTTDLGIKCREIGMNWLVIKESWLVGTSAKKDKVS
jgi:hypothetical protein